MCCKYRNNNTIVISTEWLRSDREKAEGRPLWKHSDVGKLTPSSVSLQTALNFSVCKALRSQDKQKCSEELLIASPHLYNGVHCSYVGVNGIQTVSFDEVIGLLLGPVSAARGVLQM